jgi:hypothetical protein
MTRPTDSEAVFFVKLPGNKILIEMSSLLRPKKKLECNSVRQFNEYVNHYDADLLKSDAFKR